MLKLTLLVNRAVFLVVLPSKDILMATSGLPTDTSEMWRRRLAELLLDEMDMSESVEPAISGTAAQSLNKRVLASTEERKSQNALWFPHQ